MWQLLVTFIALNFSSDHDPHHFVFTECIHVYTINNLCAIQVELWCYNTEEPLLSKHRSTKLSLFEHWIDCSIRVVWTCVCFITVFQQSNVLSIPFPLDNQGFIHTCMQYSMQLSHIVLYGTDHHIYHALHVCVYAISMAFAIHM